jgi:hypothetical protein
MKEPDYVILFADGSKYVTAATAAHLLQCGRGRIHQFIEEGKLSAKILPRSTIRIIPLAEFLEFAKKPRLPGRPPKPKKVGKTREKGRK